MPNKIKKILSFLTLSFLFVPLSIAGVCISGSNVFDTKCSGYGASTLTQTLLNYGNATFIKNFAGVPVGTSGSLNADYSAGSGTATFTATRSSTTPATYVDANGVIQLTTTSNVPRITSGFYDSTGFVSRPGLIVEGASTNLLARTDGTSYTGWASGATGGVVANVTGTPTNTNVNVPELTGIASAQSYRWQYTGIATDTGKDGGFASNTTGAASVVNGNVITLSFWARSQTGLSGCAARMTNKIRNNVNGVLSTNHSSDITLTSSWKRFTFTHTVVDATADRATGYLNVYNIHENDTADVEIWGIQLEVLPFASTFIPTTTAALTRNAETLTYPIASNRTAATESLFVKFTPLFTATQLTVNRNVISTSSKERDIGVSQSGDDIYFRPNATDTPTANIRTGVGGVSPIFGTSYVVAGIAISPTGNPNEAIYVDGTSYDSTTTVNTDWTSPAFGLSMYVGSSAVPDQQLHGIISSIAIFSDAKSATAVSNISATLRN